MNERKRRKKKRWGTKKVSIRTTNMIVGIMKSEKQGFLLLTNNNTQRMQVRQVKTWVGL